MPASSRLQNYRGLLMDELKIRQKARVQFSATTFTSYIGLTRSHFNDIIKGRRGLSEAKAGYIAKRLLLSPYEEKFFISSIVAEHGRTKNARAEAEAALAEISQQQVKILKLDLFTLVSEWQHFAILELMRFPDFRFEPKWIAKKLGIEADVAKLSMERLVKADLVTKTEQGWKPHAGMLTTTEDYPSAAIKSFHVQISGLARKALYEQPMDRREFTASIVAIDKKNLEIAKTKIRDFRSEMIQLLTGSSKKRDALYCLALQFFPLSLDRE